MSVLDKPAVNAVVEALLAKPVVASFTWVLKVSNAVLSALAAKPVFNAAVEALVATLSLVALSC